MDDIFYIFFYMLCFIGRDIVRKYYLIRNVLSIFPNTAKTQVIHFPAIVSRDYDGYTGIPEEGKFERIYRDGSISFIPRRFGVVYDNNIIVFLSADTIDQFFQLLMAG